MVVYNAVSFRIIINLDFAVGRCTYHHARAVNCTLLQPVTTVIYVWKEVLFRVVAVWRCVWTMYGALYVVTPGLNSMPELSANS